MAKVRLDSVYKVYDNSVNALNNFSLDIKDNEFIVILGPSGCGKTTLLRCIAGLEDITQGSIYLDDEKINDIDSKDRDIAMVFQNYALYPHLTVYQNLAFGLKLQHASKEEIDNKVRKTAEILDITHLLDRKPKSLSGGQQQRVALGRAMVRDPKVFLLDEPLSNLDIKLRNQTKEEILLLHNKLKTTFVYVTHDQIEALSMADRIVVMNDGKVEQIGTPSSLYEDPSNMFIATFLGNPKMNIIKSTLLVNKNKTYLSIGNDNKFDLTLSKQQTTQLVNTSYYGKDVYLGIRPEHVYINKNGNISAIVKQIDQVGDDVFLTCNIDKEDISIVIKTNYSNLIEKGAHINFDIDVENIHLFDIDSKKSILGYREENDIPCSVYKDEIIIGKYKYILPEYIKDRLILDNTDINLYLSIKVDNILISNDKDYFKLPIRINNKIEKPDYNIIYFSIDGVDGNYILKVDKALDIRKLDCIYINPKDIQLFDINNKAYISKEKVYSNETKGFIKIKNNKAEIYAFGTKLIITNNNFKEGNCKVKIKPFGPKVVLNKKECKENIIYFSSYSEYKQKGTNFIYGKIVGMENYATFKVDNDFSVYKHNTFYLQIPEDCIELI